jgi:hypothetical protein
MRPGDTLIARGMYGRDYSLRGEWHCRVVLYSGDLQVHQSTSLGAAIVQHSVAFTKRFVAPLRK